MTRARAGSIFSRPLLPQHRQFFNRHEIDGVGIRNRYSLNTDPGLAGWPGSAGVQIRGGHYPLIGKTGFKREERHVTYFLKKLKPNKERTNDRNY